MMMMKDEDEDDGTAGPRGPGLGRGWGQDDGDGDGLLLWRRPNNIRSYNNNNIIVITALVAVDSTSETVRYRLSVGDYRSHRRFGGQQQFACTDRLSEVCRRRRRRAARAAARRRRARCDSLVG